MPSKLIRRLLIANRGEIACRIMQTAAAMGIQTIAIYSDADARARHALLADEAYRIGPAEAADSYLQIDSIIALAKQQCADAIHPGYGFLSENPLFAQACEDAELVFVGPSAASMRAIGNKSAARQLAISLGIPVRPGYEGDQQSDDVLIAQAHRTGFPLMIKAAAGGGGRGMRAVDHPDQFLRALHAARSEAQAAFGDAQLLLEALISHARHIEVQLLADQTGHVVALGERDCSTQRRHQKIMEEAPAPGLNASTREAMHQAAIRLAKAVGYCGAGTVEFLLAPDACFTFLEMNTRLQVEHPVTEAVTGLDLVALQLGIAQGQPLALGAEDLAVRGHAIEARLCAEDPDTACLPQSGPVIDVEWPKLEAVRVDHGLLAGGDLPVHYDSMMAKIIAWGEDRHQARQRLQRALEQLRFIGPIDNRQLLLEALQQPAWNGESSADTTWLERWMAERPKPVIDDPWFFAAAACMLDTYIRIHGAAAGFQSTGSETDSKAAISSLLQIEAQRSARQVSIRLRSLAQGSWMMAMDHKTAMTWHPVSVVSVAEHRYRISIGQHYALWLCRKVNGYWHIDGMGHQDVLRIQGSGKPSSAQSQAAISHVRSRMHGRITALSVQVGDRVDQGQTLMHIEAMKMQHHIAAPQQGLVADVMVQAGQQVAAGQSLMRIEASD